MRAVSHAEARLKEAAKLGFSKAFAPAQRARKARRAPVELPGLEMIEVAHLSDLVARIAGGTP